MAEMAGYGPSTYGDRIADFYDRLFQQAFDVEGTVDLLADLAAGGPALEMGIGTGRVALPLAAPRGRGPGHRLVRGNGRQAARQTGRRRASR